MMKKLILSLMLGTGLANASLFYDIPNFVQDGQRLDSTNPGIGKPLTGPGFYIWGIEDLPAELISNDWDYNDLFGTLTINCDDTYFFQTLGGLGDYYNRNLVGFAGMVGNNELGWTMIFNTPSGRVLSGAMEVWVMKVGEVECEGCQTSGSEVPETSTVALAGAGLIGIVLLRRKK